jgi:uncharacterized protein (DUF779 family)
MYPLPRVTATTAAERAVADLVADRGPLMFVQSGGCCDGSAPMCFDFGEFLTGAQDILVGEVNGCPVYVDQRQLDAWPHTDLVLDVEPGYADGLSLAAGPGLHFVTRYAAPDATHTEEEQPS